MMRLPCEISMLIPGGILPTDHVHKETDDGTCSRCQMLPQRGEVPLTFWIGNGHDMLRYCMACVDAPKPEAGA